jgi:DNA uptake protein ComE-like DNA-binding protein
VVEVQGDVQSPGIYLFDGEVDALEAIAAAGGSCGECADAAAASGISTRLHSGERLRVVCPSQGRLQILYAPMDAAARLTLGQKLDLNEASAAELCLVPGMHAQTAQAIVDRRRSKAWRSLVELREISGVGPKTIAKWADYFEVRTTAAIPYH